ncbi:hypothetical protein Mapa_012093 [Marchantia paleacea]|nr:hypothetical protein Mapa_012093 [Marchantia paleacea]
MASVRSILPTILVVAVVISSLGVATAHNGHHHAPAEAPKAASASGLLPSSTLANLVVAFIGFAAARYI